MRKADYATLAETIKEERRSAMTWLTECGELNEAVARGRLGAAERIATNFANLASVNRAAFLRACGMETFR